MRHGRRLQAQKKDGMPSIKEGTAIRDIYPDYVEDGQHLRDAGAGLYRDEGKKAKAMAELEAMHASAAAIPLH